MAKKDQTIGTKKSALQDFLAQNQDIDFKKIALRDEQMLEELNWKGLTRQKSKIKKQLAGYQRLLRIMPDVEENHDIIFGLLDAEIHSALQVASIAKKTFLSDHIDLFNQNELLAESFHDNALAMRTQLLLRHMQNIQ